MTTYQRLVNLDGWLIEARHKVEPVFINDMKNETESDLQAIFESLYTKYHSDKISLLPSCRCGFIRMESALGETCPRCNTQVASSIEGDIQSVMWFRLPDGIASFMSPIIYTMMRKRFSKKQGWDLIRWFTDTGYSPELKTTPTMELVKASGLPRGWNNFIMHFDRIVEFLLSLRDFRVKKGEIDYFHYLYLRERQNFFCKVLPIPNKSLHVFEQTNYGIYRTSSTEKSTDYVASMLSFVRSINPMSPAARENRIARLMLKMSDYQINHIANEIGPKPGQIRRNVLAGKTIMSYRSVITSVTRPWDYEAIEVPWQVALILFRPMIINKLYRQGFTLNRAIDRLMEGLHTYDRLLHDILLQLKHEAPGGKIPIMIQRNPTLVPGAAQLVYVEFKTDPGDKTTGMPLPITKAPNARMLASQSVMTV